MAAVRSRAVLAGALAIAGGLVLFDPAAPQAMALAVPPPPVTVTTTVAGAVAGADGAAAVGALGATGGTAVGTTATLAGGVSATALTGTVVGGLAVGTWAGQQVLKVLPDSWYSTSGSTLCDAQLLLDPNAECAGTSASEGYVVNGDVSGAVPGWEPNPPYAVQFGYAQYSSPYGRLVVPGTISVQVSSLPYASLSGSISATITVATTFPSGSPAWNEYRDPALEFLCSVGDPGTYTPVVRSAKTIKPTQATQTWSTSDVCASGGGGNWQYAGARLRTAGQDGDSGLDLDATGASVGVFRPVGDPLRQEVGTDPERHFSASWACSDGTTGGANSVFFHESDASWPSLPAAACDAGIVTHYEVSKVTTGGPTTSILTWDAPQVVQDFYAAGGTGAECWDGSCTLVLSRVDAQTGQRLSCFSDPSLCVDWWSSPSKADDYVCTYGGNTVALAECDLYRPTFNRTMGQPTTDNDGRAVPANESSQYGDPTADGNPVPEPSGSPDPAPGPSPDNSCPPPFSWTSLFNPWWQFKAMGCALEWAFVPSADTVTAQVQATKTELLARPPLSLAAPVAGTLGGLADGWGTGCEGNVADFDPWQEGRLAFPCTPPQSAPLLVLYSITSLALVVSTGFYVWSLLVSAMNGRGGGEG